MDKEIQVRRRIKQFLGIFLILLMLGVVLFPIFGKAREGNGHSCASNLKQISLVFLQYEQDYDETLPPAAQPIPAESGVLSGWAVTHDAFGDAASSASATQTGADNGADTQKPFALSPIFSYFKNPDIFRCPNAPRTSSTLSYMLNDLASATRINDVARPARTVLLCDGEAFAGNAGHAYAPNAAPAPASYSPTGVVVLGATMQTAPTRHGGANYAFVDGHVKWHKPPAVFFPSRFSNSRVYKDARTGRVFGPNPASDHDMNAKGISATFHLR